MRIESWAVQEMARASQGKKSGKLEGASRKRGKASREEGAGESANPKVESGTLQVGLIGLVVLVGLVGNTKSGRIGRFGWVGRIGRIGWVGLV